MPSGWRGRAVSAPLVLALGAGLLSGCASSFASGSTTPDGAIVAIGAENQYADVIQAVGGKYVQASAVMSNPNTDPHAFEASPSPGPLVNAAPPGAPKGLGHDNLTPWAFQADVMNGTDPSAQDVAVERSLFTQHKAKVLVYNQQVTDSLTESFIALARANGIPVVGVYETMPEPGYHYLSWMLAEVQDLRKAVAGHASSEHLWAPNSSGWPGAGPGSAAGRSCGR